MVMDLQDIRATLEDRVAQSNIRLFLTADPQNNEEDTIPVKMMKVSVPRITKARKMTLMTDLGNGKEDKNITPSGTRRNTGHSNHPPITRCLPSASTKECIDIEYAEIDSDLGDDEGHILMHDYQTYLKRRRINKWKLNLSERV